MGLQGCVWALSHPCMELRCCTAARVALRRRWAPCRGAHGGLLCQLLVPCSLKPLARVLLPNGITHISANDLSCALIRGAGRAVGPGAVPVRLWGVPWAAPGMLCVSFGAAAPAGRPRPRRGLQLSWGSAGGGLPWWHSGGVGCVVASLGSGLPLPGHGMALVCCFPSLSTRRGCSRGSRFPLPVAVGAPGVPGLSGCDLSPPPGTAAGAARPSPILGRC